MENVNTGGLKKFVYPKGYKPPRDQALEDSVREGYREYHQRVRRNRIITILIFILVLFAITIYFILRS